MRSFGTFVYLLFLHAAVSPDYAAVFIVCNQWSTEAVLHILLQRIHQVTQQIWCS